MVRVGVEIMGLKGYHSSINWYWVGLTGTELGNKFFGGGGSKSFSCQTVEFQLGWVDVVVVFVTNRQHQFTIEQTKLYDNW